MGGCLGGCWPLPRPTPQTPTYASLATAAALEAAWRNVVMEEEEERYDKELGKVEGDEEDDDLWVEDVDSDGQVHLTSTRD